MKKVLLSMVVLVFCLMIVGCGNSKEDNDNMNNNQNQTTKDLTYFRNEVMKLDTTFTESEVYYSMVGAKNGTKIHDGEENYRIEIYSFDKSSDAYKKAESEQQLCVSDTMCFDATIKNGYAMIVDDEFPQKDQVLLIFNELR